MANTLLECMYVVIEVYDMEFWTKENCISLVETVIAVKLDSSMSTYTCMELLE